MTCIKHPGWFFKNGYGGVKKNTYAHRAAWQAASGREIPKGLDVMHACDNRWCINPEHLSVGTRKQNLMDMSTRGRAPRQASTAIVEWAMKLYPRYSSRKVAKALGVTHRSILRWAKRPT